MNSRVLLFAIFSFALIGCEEKPTQITSADLIDSWRIDSISRTTHPMVGGTIELAADGQMISYKPSGEKEEGKATVFWHLLRMESGEVVIATDSTFSVSEDFAPVLDKFANPMSVVIEGDQMTWNLLTRNKMESFTLRSCGLQIHKEKLIRSLKAILIGV
jgi:hypothetical protein